jgi:hypothetical protein
MHLKRGSSRGSWWWQIAYLADIMVGLILDEISTIHRIESTNFHPSLKAFHPPSVSFAASK